MTWHGYRDGFDERIALLSDRLRQGSWRPGPLRQVPICRFSGKVMTAVIPTVEDRVVHRAMRNCIEPVLEARAFHDFVSGYRPRRNRITAVAQAARYFVDSYRWVADVDVADVSGGSSVDEVIDWLSRWITDGTFLARVRVALAELPHPIVPGTGLAPLLINLRLVPVDEQLAHLRVARFCDNYCAFTRTKADAAMAFEEIEHVLARIGLRPAPNKSRVHGHMNPEDLFMIAG